MAADTFPCEILLPSKEVISLDVSEVVLPAHDGERGILPRHGDFVGLLGTGALKFVHQGDDYWMMVSSGSYFVRQGKLTVLAELAEPADEIDLDAAREELKRLEPLLGRSNRHEPSFAKVLVDYARTKARLDVCRRTEALH